MFYFLSNYSDVFFGLNLFRYITFRTGMAAMTTFLFCILLGPHFIKKLKTFNIREIAKRKDCPDLNQFQESKEGTPTMGGLLIMTAIVFSVVLWADLSNGYVLMTLVTAIWLAVVGGVDDFVKLTRPHHGRGLKKRTKIIWEFAIGLIVGAFVFLHPDISNQIHFPFLKDAVLSLGILYIPFVAFVIFGTSNAVNLTDGLDGLAIGCVLMVGLTLAILSYIVGHIQFSAYLFIPFVSGAGELTVVCAAIIGASLGFLWFNCHPASIFMGDVGSLPLGGALGVMAVFIKKELLLAIVGGVFVMEAVSVILQIISFRTTGKRIFKMSPIHHHLQLSGWNESKIIIRFWILAVVLALLALTTLKIR